MKITFTESCPSRLGRGSQRGILFASPGKEYEVPEEEGAGKGELEQVDIWLSQGWATNPGLVEKTKKKLTSRKGAEGTGPVDKGEPE